MIYLINKIAAQDRSPYAAERLKYDPSLTYFPAQFIGAMHWNPTSNALLGIKLPFPAKGYTYGYINRCCQAQL